MNNPYDKFFDEINKSAPLPKRALSIRNVFKRSGDIYLYAIPEILDILKATPCGILIGGPCYNSKNHFSVNGLYDFDEVLAWIEAMNEEREGDE